MIYQCALSWYEDVNMLTSPIWIIMKGFILMKFVMRYDDDDLIQGLDPMTYNKLWWLLMKLNTFQKET